jgi:hypothetical protein
MLLSEARRRFASDLLENAAEIGMVRKTGGISYALYGFIGLQEKPSGYSDLSRLSSAKRDGAGSCGQGHSKVPTSHIIDD